MPYSATIIDCPNCKVTFNGVLNDLFQVDKSYYADCPACNKHTYFYGITTVINTNIPDNAVHVGSLI